MPAEKCTRSDEWKWLYRGLSAVEREFGSLKHHYALAMLGVWLHARPEGPRSTRFELAKARVVALAA
jgi:hypothetical protein